MNKSTIRLSKVNNNTAMMPTDSDTWRTPQFRQSMVNKIDEAISHCGAPTTKNAIEMENQVFSKAKSKDEYLSFVARLIIHIKDMGSKKAGMTNQQIPPQGNQVAMGQMGGGQQGMGMMNQMNSMGNMNMMNQQGMMQMSPGMNPNQNSMMQAALAQQQQQQQQQQQPMSQQQQNSQMISQQNFMQQQAQMQNQQQQQQQLQNSQLQNQQLQNIQNQQQQQQQQLQNNQMQNQQLQNVQQMQNAQQMQDHMRNVQLGNVQSQNSPMAPIQMGSQIGNTQQGPGDTQQIRAQIQNQQQQQQQMHPQIQGGGGGPIPGSPMQNIMLAQQQQQQQQQQQSQQQQMMAGRGIGNRMMGPQPNMANHLSQIAKQQQQNQQRGIHRPPNVDNVTMSQQYSGPNAGMNAGMIRNVPPSQFIGQGPPGQGNIGQTPPSPGGSNNPSQNPNYANSPAQSISTLMPSPAAPGMNTANLRSFQNHSVPSPGSSLNTSINTPLMAASTPSPRNPDDQACIDKIKELRKYTDLLQRMIAKIGNDDVEKSSKMKKLLEILTNPNQRVSMEILIKCEVALKKMERQQSDPGGVLVGSTSTPQPPPMKDQSQVSPFQQVMDALAGTLRNPSSSHTLLRTFRPTVEALTGHSFGACFQNYEEEEGSSDGETNENDIPSVLKRELRALDSHFKVTIFKRGGGLVRLTCHLKCPQLPRVPPLKINVRAEYPYDPPVVIHLARDYGSTSFLQAIARAYKSRFLRLTPNHTVTELLYMWEMCIRQGFATTVRH